MPKVDREKDQVSMAVNDIKRGINKTQYKKRSSKKQSQEGKSLESTPSRHKGGYRHVETIRMQMHKRSEDRNEGYISNVALLT